MRFGRFAVVPVESKLLPRLRTDRWLYVRYDDPKQGIELYDLRKDPDNLENLAYDPRSSAVVAVSWVLVLI